jgi:hypothetical protein
VSTDISEFSTEEIAYIDLDGSTYLSQFSELEAIWASPGLLYFITPEDPLPEDVMTVNHYYFGLQVFQLSRSDTNARWDWQRVGVESWQIGRSS